MIREMQKGDAEVVLDIYAYGIKTRNATFETRLPSWEEWDANHLDICRLVCEQDAHVVGWAALAPMSTRACYRGVAEASVYVAQEFIGRGLGSKLLDKAIEGSEQNGIWTLFASVFPENLATVRLHQRFGFRKLGTRRKIAKLDGRWRDTLILERRSKIVGVE